MNSAHAGIVFLDTSVLVEALRRDGRAGVRSAVHDAIETGAAIINGMVRVELLRGARDREMFERLDALLDGVVTVPTRSDTWDSAADLGFTLRRVGVSVPTSDIVVAASALQNDAMILHTDRHFEAIAAVSELRQTYAADPGMDG